jgi:hypothetical protein
MAFQKLKGVHGQAAPAMNFDLHALWALHTVPQLLLSSRSQCLFNIHICKEKTKGRYSWEHYECSDGDFRSCQSCFTSKQRLHEFLLNYFQIS